MKKDNLIYVRHIFDTILRIEEYTNDIEHQHFISNNLLQAGIVRELEIIGEASKSLSTEFKENYPDIPWKQMAGMRDKLIHGYFSVDLDAVWETVKKDIPSLKVKLKKIIG